MDFIVPQQILPHVSQQNINAVLTVINFGVILVFLNVLIPKNSVVMLKEGFGVRILGLVAIRIKNVVYLNKI